jgi:hypothetical protein
MGRSQRSWPVAQLGYLFASPIGAFGLRPWPVEIVEQHVSQQKQDEKENREIDQLSSHDVSPSP